MTTAHIATAAWTWFRPISIWPLATIFLYGLYFATAAGANRPTADSHLAWLLATATPAFWLGQCIRDAQAWPSCLFVPGYSHRPLAIGATAAALSLLLSLAAAWIGNLSLASATALATLTTIVALLAGFHFHRAAFATVISIMAVLLLGAFAAGNGPVSPLVNHPITSAAALLASAPLLIHFLRRARALVADPSRRHADRHAGANRPASQLICGLRQRSSCRTVVFFAAGAVLTVMLSAYHVGGGGLDGAWVYVAGLLVWATAPAQSASFPHGRLAEATALLLLGAAETRTAIGRQMMWRTLADLALGSFVFVAIVWTLSGEARLIETSAALAACHLYLAIASGSAWLLSSRSSVVIAMPFVLLVTWISSQWMSMPWPAAAILLVASAATAIYWGGKRIGRLDFVA